MFKQILKRILIAIPVLFAISILVFLMIHMLPGDPIEIIFGKNPNPEQIALVRAQYHLDEPLHIQYWTWLKGFIAGDWGTSFTLKIPVREVVLQRAGRSFVLCIFSIVVSLCLALPLGILSAVKNNTATDFAISAGSLVMVSIPSFFLGVLMVLLFAVKIPIFMASGFVPLKKGLLPSLRSIILPSVTLGIVLCAYTIRYIRSSMLETMNQDYVMLARAKGHKERTVLYVHALRNAMIPIVTQIGMQVGALLGGEIVIDLFQMKHRFFMTARIFIQFRRIRVIWPY